MSRCIAKCKSKLDTYTCFTIGMVIDCTYYCCHKWGYYQSFIHFIGLWVVYSTVSFCCRNCQAQIKLLWNIYLNPDLLFYIFVLYIYIIFNHVGHFTDSNFREISSNYKEAYKGLTIYIVLWVDLSKTIRILSRKKKFMMCISTKWWRCYSTLDNFA